MHTTNVGSDELRFERDLVVIHARNPIADWRVREFCRNAIYFEGHKYFLLQRNKAERPFAARYTLAPWPDDLHEESPRSFIYDEDFVASRDAGFFTERRRSVAWHLLLPVYPLLGLCWTGVKERVLWPIGFVPTSITSASVMLVFCITFLDSIFFGYLGGGVVIRSLGAEALGGWAVLADFLLIGLLALDCMVRFGQLLEGEEPVPDGFLEWVFRRFQRQG